MRSWSNLNIFSRKIWSSISDRAAVAGLQRILVVGDRNALLRRQHRHVAAGDLMHLATGSALKLDIAEARLRSMIVVVRHIGLSRRRNSRMRSRPAKRRSGASSRQLGLAQPVPDEPCARLPKYRHPATRGGDALARPIPRPASHRPLQERHNAASRRCAATAQGDSVSTGSGNSRSSAGRSRAATSVSARSGRRTSASAGSRPRPSRSSPRPHARDWDCR